MLVDDGLKLARLDVVLRMPPQKRNCVMACFLILPSGLNQGCLERRCGYLRHSKDQSGPKGAGRVRLVVLSSFKFSTFSVRRAWSPT